VSEKLLPPRDNLKKKNSRETFPPLLVNYTIQVGRREKKKVESFSLLPAFCSFLFLLENQCFVTHGWVSFGRGKFSLSHLLTRRDGEELLNGRSWSFTDPSFMRFHFIFKFRSNKFFLNFLSMFFALSTFPFARGWKQESHK
jgi:hypothetical protein